MAAQQQGNFAEAEKDWRAAVAQNPKDAVAYANLGFVLAHQNKYRGGGAGLSEGGETCAGDAGDSVELGDRGIQARAF